MRYFSCYSYIYNMKFICTVMHYRLQACLRTLGISGTPRGREACASGARYIRKFGNLFTDSPPVPPERAKPNSPKLRAKWLPGWLPQ